MNKAFVFLSLLLVIACDSEEKLEKSVFIPDPLNADLPQYSEYGYNTFGVYYDRAAFVSEEFAVPAKIIVTEGATQFILRGTRSTGAGRTPMQLQFRLTDIDPQNPYDLSVLHAKDYDLANENIVVTIVNGEYETVVSSEVLEGTLSFRRFQKLFIDDQPTQVILSGVFAFKIVINGEPVSFKNGRFDLGISSGNFFRL